MHMYSNLSKIRFRPFLVNCVQIKFTPFCHKFCLGNLRSFGDKLGFKNQCLETKNILWAPGQIANLSTTICEII
jgi:hypothetical protein